MCELMVLPSIFFAGKDSECKVSVFLEGDYNTLHDICCRQGRQQQQQPSHRAYAPERARAVRRFYTALAQLTRGDKLLVHIDSFRDHLVSPSQANRDGGGVDREGGGNGEEQGEGGGAAAMAEVGAVDVDFAMPGPAVVVPEGICRGVPLFQFLGATDGKNCLCIPGKSQKSMPVISYSRAESVRFGPLGLRQLLEAHLLAGHFNLAPVDAHSQDYTPTEPRLPASEKLGQLHSPRYCCVVILIQTIS